MNLHDDRAISAEADDLDWDELLLYLDEERIVPVIGDALMCVEHEGELRTIESIVAADLAGQLGVARPGDGPELRIAEVSSRYLASNGPGAAKRLYSKIKVILDRHRFPVPHPVRQLAEIRGLQTFLTTSIAPLIRVALDEVRSGGRSEAQQLSFSPYTQPDDIDVGPSSNGALVYHLFGIAASMPDYVVTEEDLIEFLHGLQSADHRPQNLFDHLRGRHLLFLGCGYDDWLARFFIRTLRDERFANWNRQKSEFVIDTAVGRDDELVVFLKQYDSRVFCSMSAVEFVDELHRRWTERYGEKPAAAAPAPETAHIRAMPEDSVFLSYAREDIEHARSVARALEGAGIDVWFDERSMSPGDDWDNVIRDHIGRCSLFIPLISRNTASAAEGYFLVEWRLAIKRSMRMAENRPFILPLAVDDTDAEAPNVPSDFKRWHWTRLTDPAGLETIAELSKKYIRQLRAPYYQ